MNSVGATVFLVVILLVPCALTSSDADVISSVKNTLIGDGFVGTLHPYGSYAYEKFRLVQNGACNRKLFPLLIARPTSTEDVAAAVAAAKYHGLELSVRSGGHGYTCNNLKNGSLHLDLRRLNKVHLVKPPSVSQHKRFEPNQYCTMCACIEIGDYMQFFTATINL